MSEYPYSIGCSACGYTHNNGPSNSVNLKAGDFCPKCGEQFSEGDGRTKDEVYDELGIEPYDTPQEEPDEPDSMAESWEFDCNRCSHSVEDVTKSEAYVVAGEHEDHTGHFSFGIYFEGELVDGSE